MPLDAKDIYDHAGKNLIYFVGYRIKILTGYFATLAALAFAFAWVQNNLPPKTRAFVAVLGVLLTVSLWLLDWRNRDAYRDCYRAGASLERSSGVGDGVYCRLKENSAKTKLAHSRTINWLFGLLSVVFVVFAAALWRDAGLFAPVNRTHALGEPRPFHAAAVVGSSSTVTLLGPTGRERHITGVVATVDAGGGVPHFRLAISGQNVLAGTTSGTFVWSSCGAAPIVVQPIEALEASEVGGDAPYVIVVTGYEY